MAQIRTLINAIRTFKSWPSHVLDYVGLMPSRVMRCRLRNGAVFNVRSRTSDSMVLREVWINKDYDPDHLKFPAGGVIVDVGGHIGSFAILAARKSPAARIFTLEPTPDSFKLLNENLKLNGISNVTPLNVALLSTSGEREIGMCDNQVSHSFYFTDANAQKISVKGISLAQLMIDQKIEQIDYMKLDCEGAEFEILMQCPDEILARIKQLAAEVHEMDASRSRASLGAFLRTKGFTVIEDPVKVWMLYATRA